MVNKVFLFAACAIVFILAAVFAAAAAAAAARPKAHELSPSYTYAQYLTDFGKKRPATDAEFHQREQIFVDNLRDALYHNINNAKPGPGKSYYKKGINQFSDWTSAELKKLTSAKTNKMEPVKKELLSKPFVLEHKIQTTAGFPPALDYRNSVPAVLTAVKNQGMCGSCYAHGSTESLESHYALATGELFVMSTQMVTNCAAEGKTPCGGTGHCEGSIAEYVFDWAVQNGMTTEWAYPYLSIGGKDYACPAAKDMPAAVAKFSSYVKVQSNNQVAVMDALMNKGPLAINVMASQWSSYEGGIFGLGPNECQNSSNIDIDHVVQLTGWGQDFINGKHIDYWVVRNSWDTSYGEDGYIRVLKTDVPSCGTDSTPADGTGCKGGPATQHVCGTCGLLFDTSYPIAAGGSKSVKKH